MNQMNKKIEEILRHRLDTDATGISIAVDDLEQLLDNEMVKLISWMGQNCLRLEKDKFFHMDELDAYNAEQLKDLYKSQCG